MADAEYPAPTPRNFAGLKVMVENPAGSTRSGVSREGKPWSVKMAHDYGFLSRATGEDGEGLDVFLGPSEDAPNAYVVHQNDPSTGTYDEDKVMLGFPNGDAAKSAYLANYDRPDFFRSMTEIPMDRFRGMLTAADPASVTWKHKQRRNHRTTAMLSRTFYLSNALLDGPNPSIAQPSLVPIDPPAGMPTAIGSERVQYFRGYGFKIGQTYRHPVKRWHMDATQQFADDLNATFRQMSADGNRVPVVDNHNPTLAKGLGRVVGIEEQSGWFEPILQIVGEDAIRQASRNEISVGIENFIDGTGRDYGLALVHVAITPYPVVPGQGGLRIAASRGQDTTDAPVIFHLAANNSHEGVTMHAVQVSPEHLAFARRMCDMADGDAPDLVMSRFVDKAKALTTAHEQVGNEHKELLDKHKALVGQHEALVKEHDAAKIHMSRAGVSPVATDPEVLHERSLRISDRLDALVGNGWAPADIDRLKPILLGTAEQPNVYNLSRATGQKDCSAAAFVEWLRECKPAPKTGERSKQQQIHMARPQDSAPPAPAGDGSAKGKSLIDIANEMNPSAK